MFVLDPRLADSCFRLGSGPLSELLLSKNAAYPWLILVPRIANIKDLIDLSDTQQALFLHESNAISRWLIKHYQPDKLNVAAIGNIVSQLHIHHVARYKSDPSWPEPIWGRSFSAEYDAVAVDLITAEIQMFASDLFA